MSQPLCPKCRQPVPAGAALCPVCAAPLAPAAAGPEHASSSAPSFDKMGQGTIGNVTATYDASQSTQIVTNQNTTAHSVHHHHYGPARAWGIFLALATITVFILWQFNRQPPAEEKPVIQPVNQPVIQNIPDSPAVPVITDATVGMVTRGQFQPVTDFKSGDVLTLRVRVDRPGHLRVLYLPAQGPPVRMFPERDGAPDHVGGDAILIPDPAKLAAATPDCTAFQLYHDTGSGPPIREQILVQASDEPFTDDGSIRKPDSSYRVYDGLTLAEVRTRGVKRLEGLSAAEVQSRADKLVPERTLSFTIRP